MGGEHGLDSYSRPGRSSSSSYRLYSRRSGVESSRYGPPFDTSWQPPPLPHVGPGGTASTSTTTKSFSNACVSAPYGNEHDVSMSSSRSNDDPGKAVALVLIDLAVSLGCCAFASYLANCLLKRLQNISSNTRGDPDDGSVNGKAIQKSLQWIVAKR
jgi:hypothetical protein